MGVFLLLVLLQTRLVALRLPPALHVPHILWPLSHILAFVPAGHDLQRCSSQKVLKFDLYSPGLEQTKLLSRFVHLQ